MVGGIHGNVGDAAGRQRGTDRPQRESADGGLDPAVRRLGGVGLRRGLLRGGAGAEARGQREHERQPYVRGHAYRESQRMHGAMI